MDLTGHDPDFVRLMQGTIKLTDFTELRQRELIEYARVNHFDISAIKDKTTREMIAKWDKMFP